VSHERKLLRANERRRRTLSRFELKVLETADPEVKAERGRILKRVRSFAKQVGERSLDKAWAYLTESAKDYDPKKDGISLYMACVADWQALEEIEKEDAQG